MDYSSNLYGYDQFNDPYSVNSAINSLKWDDDDHLRSVAYTASDPNINNKYNRFEPIQPAGVGRISDNRALPSSGSPEQPSVRNLAFQRDLVNQITANIEKYYNPIKNKITEGFANDNTNKCSISNANQTLLMIIFILIIVILVQGCHMKSMGQILVQHYPQPKHHSTDATATP